MDKGEFYKNMAGVLCLLLFISSFFNGVLYRKNKEKPNMVTSVQWKTRTDTSTVIDTVRLVETRKIPVVRRDTVSNIRYLTDTLVLKSDSVVEIPITQKVYRDSSYVAYVSGYQQNLDSITVRYPVVTKTVKETEYKNKLFGVGLVGGFGYGFSSKKLEPFVGVGISLNLTR